MTLQIERQLFTVEEYHKMAEAGIIKPSDRVELIHGEVLKRSPIKSPHASVVDYLNETIGFLLHGKAIIRVQNPIEINHDSEPEPDIAIVQCKADRYRDHHPTAEDVFLLIEVADSSLEFDREVKMPLYASAKIPEAWIINLPEQRVEVYRNPEKGQYKLTELFFLDDTLPVPGFGVQLSVRDIFG